MNNDGLEQMLLLRNFEMQLYWMCYALNTMDMTGEYEKYQEKVGKINNTLGKAKRAMIRLEKEIRDEQDKKGICKAPLVWLTAEEAEQVLQSSYDVLSWANCGPTITEQAMHVQNLLKQRIENSNEVNN